MYTKHDYPIMQGEGDKEISRVCVSFRARHLHAVTSGCSVEKPETHRAPVRLLKKQQNLLLL